MSTWIQTFTGKQFWPFDPKIEDLCIYDIAHALSNLCRYTGHCKRFYSVAQHSVLGAHYIGESDPVMFLTFLLHDASEAYLGDVARPIKHLLPQYQEAEVRLESLIAERYKLYFPYPKIIKGVDNMLLNTERRALMSNPLIPWNTYGVGYLDLSITPWSPEASEEAFLKSFFKITGTT